MKIERVDLNEIRDSKNKNLKKPDSKYLDYLIYFSIASLIVPFGFILAIYVLFKLGDKKVKGNTKIAKIIAWIQIFFTILGIFVMINFPELVKPFIN